MALVDLNLCDDEVTEFLYRHYSTSHDKEILRGINQYILKFDKADLFIDALVFQLKNVDRFEYIGSYHYVCLKNLKEENSFMNCQWWHGTTVHISMLAFATVGAAVEKKKFQL